MVVNSMSYATYDSYKDSGVDWLGEIPSDWQSKKLGILLTEFSKKNNPNLPLLSITRELGVITRDMDDQESNHNFIPDDLSGYKLLKEGQFGMNKMKAWQGSYGISKYTGIVSPAYYVFDVSNEIYPNFFNIAIRSKFYVDFFGSASDGVRIGQWDLNKTRMREIPFIFPSLEQQKKIYEFLSKKIKQIDQAISLKQQQIEKLNEYKQIVIQNAVTKGLNPNVPMKDSGVEWIGNIPEHWEVISLRYLFNFLNYRRIPISAELRGNIQGIYPYYGASGIIDYIDKYIFDEKLILIAEDGANLLSKSTPLAFIAEGKYWVNNHAHILKPKHEGFEYWAELLSCCDYTKYISGSAQPKLSRENLGSVRLVLPYREEILEISKLINQIKPRYDDAISKHEAQIDRLKEYKNILINQAVTGKIKI